MISRYMGAVILLFAFGAFGENQNKKWVGIKMNTLFERDLKVWAQKNSLHTYETNPRFYPAKIILDKKLYKAKIRIRGDLSKHWKNEAKSLRVNLISEGYKDYRSFDFILAEDKGYELEAAAYLISEKIGLFTPFWQFVDVQLNHKKLGPYLMRGRWHKTPIISENNAWLDSLKSPSSHYKNVFKKEVGFNPLYSYPHIYQARGDADQRFVAMTKFANMLEHMQKNDSIKWSNFVNLDNAAKWMAIVLYLGSEHPALGDNLRWLFDIKTKTFSPILYDVLPVPRILRTEDCLYSRFERMNPWFQMWMKDKSIKDKVLTHLNILLESDYFIKFWNQLAEGNNDLFVGKEKDRDKIKKIILQNIEVAKKYAKNNFCPH